MATKFVMTEEAKQSLHWCGRVSSFIRPVTNLTLKPATWEKHGDCEWVKSWHLVANIKGAPSVVLATVKVKPGKEGDPTKGTRTP